MLLARRSLLQSAAALLAPLFPSKSLLPMGSIPPLAEPAKSELESALERYLRSMEVNYRLRDSLTLLPEEEVMPAIRKQSDERIECLEAKDALGAAIIRANGIDPEGYEYSFIPLMARIPDAVLIVHGHNAPENGGNMPDLGLYDGITFAILPRSSALRHRIESLPKFDPCYDPNDFEDEED